MTYHKLFEGLINNCGEYSDGKCSKCSSGYYMNAGGTCSEMNDEECIEADTSGKCTACNDGYSANTSGTCTTNVENCGTYSTSGCQTCAGGYSKINNACVYNYGGCLNSSCSTKYYNGYTAYRVGNTGYYALNRNMSSNWFTAMDSCPGGMRIPNNNELLILFDNSWTGRARDGGYWSSDTDGNRAYGRSFDRAGQLYRNGKYGNSRVVCIGN